MTASDDLIDRLRSVVGRRAVLTTATRTRRFTTGYRFGGGSVLAVVRPRSLVELWRALQACVEAGVFIIMQSANTGLTGGSTPDGDYDRDVVLINTLRITGIHVIDQGRQVVCLPGATLHALELALRPHNREPHSVIGSSCIGASVFGGVCNNSGGSLVQRGPAYTQLALYARLDENRRLQLVNHLGIALGDDPESMLDRLENGRFGSSDITHDPARRASDHDYCDHVRKVDEATPARFNADPSRLYEASGSAGKIVLFAVRLDTFPAEVDTATFYIGTNSTADLAQIRRDILGTFDVLPIAGEYIHREAFDITARYGKDTVIAIERLGTHSLPALFAFKARFDEVTRRLPLLPENLSDRLMQAVSRVFGNHLPARLWSYRNRFEHHLILKMGTDCIAQGRRYLNARYPSDVGDFFECTDAEATKAFLHRFAVAGAAIRYRAIHAREVEDIIALDIALRRNDSDWFERLPEAIERHIFKRLYYGHFFCHVFHQDYVMAKGTDVIAVEHQMLELLDRRGAEYPAEHNVGHLYPAKPQLTEHYRRLDPCNRFNPGIGKTSRQADWQ